VSTVDAQPPYQQGICDAPGQFAYYNSSQNQTISINDGHHANLWTAASFWSTSYTTATPVPAGPLGGQADCETMSTGTVCTWYDNDTWGELAATADVSQSQAASLLLVFRGAIEQPD
jgi:hypothetical protein